MSGDFMASKTDLCTAVKTERALVWSSEHGQLTVIASSKSWDGVAYFYRLQLCYQGDSCLPWATRDNTDQIKITQCHPSFSVSLPCTCALFLSPFLKMTLFSAAIHQFLITAEVSITTHCHTALISSKLRRELVIRKKATALITKGALQSTGVSRRDKIPNRKRTNVSTSTGPGPDPQRYRIRTRNGPSGSG